MKKFLIVFGTRPEAIKLAPVIKQFKSQPGLEAEVCITSQHDELLMDALNIFKIDTSYDLQIMEESQTLIDITQKVLVRLSVPFIHFNPDMVIVQGDTTSAFTAALAAYYHKIPIAHVEAGLRTGDKYHPYPEEMNRVMIDHMSDILFAPTWDAYKNLTREHISIEKIVITGNTAIDALQMIQPEALQDPLPSVDILVTLHRRENWDYSRLKNICKGINTIVEHNPDTNILWVLHPNPAIRNNIKAFLSGNKKIIFSEPVDYKQFLKYMMSCRFIMTDSGGIQEEAPSLNKPVIILRDKTERPEVVKFGAAEIAGPFDLPLDSMKMIVLADTLLNDEKIYKRMAEAANPYGDGTAAKKIVEALKSWSTG